MEVLEHYDTLTPHPQEGEATYASKLTPENCHLDFTQTAAQICNTIRGLNPFPAARFDFRGEACKAYVAEAAEPSDDPLTFACADGAVRITQLQRPGKARMSAEDFLRGLRA
jgi:methionyl-tRNA formyltransferase